MPETLEQLTTRVNTCACLLPDEPTARITVRDGPKPKKGRRNMAQKVKLSKGKEFNFAAAKTQASKYPWDEWFNGDLLMLEQSVGTKDEKGTVVEVTEKRDFEVATDAMPAKLKTAARRRYKVVQISKRDADGNKLDNALIIKARDMDTQERQDEDLLRAEEREARKAKGEDTTEPGDDQTEAAA